MTRVFLISILPCQTSLILFSLLMVFAAVKTTAQEPDESWITWLDIGPSEDSGNQPVDGNILISSDNQQVLFNNRYLWNRKTGTFVEYTGHSEEQVRQERARLFANPPHSKRSELFTRTSINNCWQLTKSGFFCQSKLLDFRGVPIRSTDVVSWIAGHGGRFLLFREHGRGDYMRQPLGIFDTETLLGIAKIPGPQDPDRVNGYVVSQSSPNSVAYLYNRGAEFNYGDADGKRRVAQFRFPAEWEDEVQVENAWIVNQGKWLMLKVYGGNGRRLEFVDMTTQNHLTDYALHRNLDEIDVNATGDQLILVYDGRATFYNIKDNGLEELILDEGEEDIHFAFDKSSHRAVSADGTLMAFTISNNRGYQAGLLDLRSMLAKPLDATVASSK